MNEDRSCSVIYQKMVQISPLDSHHWLDPLEISSNGEKQKQTEQRKKNPKPPLPISYLPHLVHIITITRFKCSSK